MSEILSLQLVHGGIYEGIYLDLCMMFGMKNFHLCISRIGLNGQVHCYVEVCVGILNLCCFWL